MTKVDGQWKMSFYQVYLVSLAFSSLESLELLWVGDSQADTLIRILQLCRTRSRFRRGLKRDAECSSSWEVTACKYAG